MKTYGDLDLKKVMEDNSLDFAHFTYMRGQCSCCYGPMDMPARYWHGSKKPVEIREKTGEHSCSIRYELDGKPFDMDRMKYILFKNAENGSGTVKRTDVIDDHTCVMYSKNLYGVLEKICRDLAEQLDEDYVVIVPDADYSCIVIRVTEKLQPWMTEKKELDAMRKETAESGAVIAWEDSN